MRFTAILLTALSLLALLAGCSSPQAPPPTSTSMAPLLPDHPATTVYHFAGAVPADAALLTGNNTAMTTVGNYTWIGSTTYEPSIGANMKTGSIFMTNFGGTGRGTHIMRGIKNGTEWKDVGPSIVPFAPTGPLPNSNDPYMYVDPWTGRVFDFDMCGTLSGFCEYISDDDGATWTLRTIATGEQSALDHQSLAAAPAGEGVTTAGYPNVLAFCVNRGLTSGGSWCSTSRDGGITFTPLLPGFPANSQQCSGLSGHIKGSADGRFYRGNPSCAGPAVYRSDDAGVTWSEHTINATVGIIGHDVEVSTDARGHLYAFWIGGDGLPYLAVSPDHGDSWPVQMMVAPPGVTAAGFPAVAAGADGRVVVAYVGSTIEKGFEGTQSKATWNGYLGILTDAMSAKPLITTVTVNNPDKDPLAKGQCGDVRCGGFGDFIDVTIDPSGRPWAAFSNNQKGEAGIAGTITDGPALLGDLKPLGHVTVGGPRSIKG